MKFLKSKKEPLEQNLRYLLHKHLSGYEPARSIQRIHASDLTNDKEEFCARRHALLVLTNTKPKDKFVGTCSRVAWSMSRIVQDEVTRWFADMGKAVGRWECSHCSTLTEIKKRPYRCAQCDGGDLLPVEPRFLSAISGASCGIDLLVDTGVGKLTIVEIKALQKEDFKRLKAPVAEHRYRTNLYMRLVEECEDPISGSINTQEAIVLYVAKAGWGDIDPQIQNWGFTEDKWSPFKAYTVRRDDTQTDEVCKKGQAWAEWKKGGSIPKGICPTPICNRAQHCEVGKRCFTGESNE